MFKAYFSILIKLFEYLAIRKLLNQKFWKWSLGNLSFMQIFKLLFLLFECKHFAENA